MRLAALALLVIAAGPAHAQPDPSAMTDEVHAHWERGLAEHAAKNYAAASAEFAACYRLAQRRECLFAWAQAARLAGDCEAASELYRRYLREELSPRQIEAARRQLAVCEAELAARPRAEPVPPPAPAMPATLPPAPGVPPRSPWYRDAWGDALTGTGVAAIAAGALLYASARRDAASGSPSYDAYAERFRSAERARNWALGAMTAGSALIAGGLLHIALRDDTPAPSPRVGVAVSLAQLTLACSGTF